MTIIFLDFDGVIRMPVFGGERLEGEFCKQRMARVQELADRTGALIVISSDWKKKKGKEQILRLLTSIKSRTIHEDWATQDLASADGGPVPRGSEIVAWLFRHPETRRFIILDDISPDHFPGMSERQIKCALSDGFTEERFDEALAGLS